MKRSLSSVVATLLALLCIVSFPAVAQVSFFQPPTYMGSGNVFVADFNGDGNPDILTSDGTLNLGSGAGTFTLGLSLSSSAVPIIAVADFNGDGKPDVLEFTTGTLLVLLGNGDGTFQPAINTPSGASLQFGASADLNGDGKADFVGMYYNGPTEVVVVYISNGDGTFTAGQAFTLTSYPIVLTFGDFNGDGKTDIALSAPNSEEVLLGNGDGTFQTPILSAGVGNPDKAGAGDFNGDGKLDLAITDEGGCIGCPAGNIEVLLGNGDGTFQASLVAFPGYPGPLLAADVDGDGKSDLIIGSDENIVQIYLSNGDGTFSNSDSYAPNLIYRFMKPPEQVLGLGAALADFNKDGKLDIATGNAILLGNGDGSFEGIPVGNANGGPPSDVVIAVFEKTSAPGAADLTGDALTILHNDGTGRLSVLQTYPVPGFQMAAGDFNGDGNVDLVVFSDPDYSDQNYTVLLGNGDGSFQSPVSYPQHFAAPGPGIIEAADFNHDGKQDLLVSAMGQNGVAILMGNGDGTFAPPALYYTGGYAPTAVADFNNDGNLDIVAASFQYGGVTPLGTALLLGKGDGTFQTAVFPTNLTNFQTQFASDLRGNGDVDLVSASGQVALGNGDGTFQVVSTYAAPLAVADVNGDGKPDLIGASSILPGRGDGTFGAPVPIYGPLPPPVPLPTIADMNGDGKPDIVFRTGLFFGGVAELFNTTPISFTLAASALSPSPIIAGNAGTSTVAATAIFGFSGAITLSCGGLPTGASCVFNPPSISNGSGTSTLMLNTSANTAAGTYNVQVEGSAGSLVGNIGISLVVQAPPDFSIAAASGSSTSQTISPGQEANFSLTLSPLGLFTGTVNLTCAITPVVNSGPTCTPANSSLQLNGNPQSFNFAVGTTAPATASAVIDHPFPMWGIRVLLACTLLVLLCASLRNRKGRVTIAIPAILYGLVLITSCGGSSSHMISGTPQGTYTVTVTATSGSLNHNTAVQVIVQ